MTDLSKVPDLELRQKIKPINDQMDAIDAQIEKIRSEHYQRMDAAMKPLNDQRDKLDAQLEEILNDREIVATCASTGLPIFDEDETVEQVVLAAVA